MKIKILLLFVFVTSSVVAQKYTILKSDFTLIEKRNEADAKNSLILGKVEYNSNTNEAEFLIKFPEEEKWGLKDSILTKYNQDTITSKQSVGTIGDNFIFKTILMPNSNDFGLKEVGFEIEDVEENNGTITITWSPPGGLKTIISSAETKLNDNLITSVTFRNTEGEIINQTFYEKYEIVNDMPIPVHISTRYKSDEKSLIKVLKLKNVIIE